jgi:NADH-quinone oxidoreductase subunit N
MQYPWALILPHIVLAGAAFLIFCIGALRPRQAMRPLFALSLAASGTAGLLPFLVPDPAASDGLIDGSGFGLFFQVLICSLTFLVLLFTGTYARARNLERDELYAPILLAALGMILLSGARDWIILFIGLEMLSIGLYVLIAARPDLPGSLEGAVKYFVLGAVASAFLVFGIGLLYAATGETGVAASVGQTPDGILLLGLAFVLVGFGFKLSLAPFHLWTPDVYQGAPAPLTGFLATGSKVAAIAALLRVILAVSPETMAALAPALWVLAALTMVAGNIAALTQQRLKRMLGYSSAAHMGYVLMALLAVPVVGPVPVMFYAAVYACMDLGAFGALAMLSPLGPDLDDALELRSAGYSRPWPAAVFGVSLLALAGFPPTAGFMGKLLLFWAALEGGYPVLAGLGMLTVAAAAYYYIRPLTLLYTFVPGWQTPLVRIPPAGHCALALALLGLLVLGIAPAPVLDVLGAIPVP